MGLPRILIIHNESQYFAGAERVLEHFVLGARGHVELALAAPDGSRILKSTDGQCQQRPIPPDKRRSAISSLLAQAKSLIRFREMFAYDVVHGWAARDWELTWVVGALSRVPAIGTLHDHPMADFHSTSRRNLMRLTAKFGLRQVVCVSDAVRKACAKEGYPRNKLEVVKNGLPEPYLSRQRHVERRNQAFRLGFLGTFTEGKGLRGLFEILAQLAVQTTAPWELRIAGTAQGGSGEALIAGIKARYADYPWWPQVKWLGWMDGSGKFLSSIDLLICPSNEFDSLPTVLLEAGAAGTPALASKVGGVPEIVEDGVTGWLFQSGDWKMAANTIARLIMNQAVIEEAGASALRRIREEFSIEKMVSNYRAVYSNLA